MNKLENGVEKYFGLLINATDNFLAGEYVIAKLQVPFLLKFFS